MHGNVGLTNFMTAEELKITDPVRDALIKTLNMLEGGELKYFNLEDGERWREPSFGQGDLPTYFNMGEWREGVKDHEACGTCCCIGGTVESIIKYPMPDADMHQLEELFFPSIQAHLWNFYSAQEAATVLRRYLVTGKVDWHPPELAQKE